MLYVRLPSPALQDMTAHLGDPGSFDFMGDMAFSESFQMMREGRDNIGIWHALELGMKQVSL